MPEPWQIQAQRLGWSTQDLALLAWDEAHQHPRPWHGVEVHAHWIVVRCEGGLVRSHLPGRVLAGPCRHYADTTPEPETQTQAIETPRATTAAVTPVREEVAVLLLDTETTGLLSDRVHLVEIAANVCTLPAGDLGRGAQRLVRPPCRIPQDATRIHGIRDEHVRSAPPFAVVWPRFRAFVEACGVRWIVAHNAPFDRGVLDRELARLGEPQPDWTWVDSGPWIRKLRPGLPSYALDRLARAAGIPGGQEHRARGDVRLLAQVLRWALGGRHPDAVPPRVLWWPRPEHAQEPAARAQQLGMGGAR